MAVTGRGFESLPYILTEPADLNHIRTHLTSHYRLGNDIDMTGYGNFATIGALSPTGQRFSGSFDGNGFQIKGLKIRSTTTYTGLFGALTATATIKNLAIVDVDIESTQATTGVIAGVGLTNSTVENCYTSGSVNGTSRTGGLVGNMEGTIRNCFSFANITGTDEVYGLANIGAPASAGVHYSHFYGTVEGTSENVGAITGTRALVGDRTTYCFYDSDIAGLSNEVGTPLSSAEMKNPANFSTWSTSFWTLEEGKYPYLTTFGEPVFAAPPQKKTIKVSSHVDPIVSFLTKNRRMVVTTTSYTLPIAQDVHKKLLTSCTSIIDEITSSVILLKNAKIETHVVNSYLQELSIHSKTVAKAIRNVSSYIDPVASYVELVIPQRIGVPVYATVHFVVNPSMGQVEVNKSVIEILNNKTTADNLTGKSVISHEENRTNKEVI